MIRIETAQPLTGHTLKVRFNDGLEGIYPVEPERRSGVFLKLLDVRGFDAVTINPHFVCVEWPGGIELCPDTMRSVPGLTSRAERQPEYPSRGPKP